MALDKKRFSVIDEYGGERYTYLGTSLVLGGDKHCVVIYDNDSANNDYYQEYVKAIINLPQGWSIVHTKTEGTASAQTTT